MLKQSLAPFIHFLPASVCDLTSCESWINSTIDKIKNVVREYSRIVIVIFLYFVVTHLPVSINLLIRYLDLWISLFSYYKNSWNIHHFGAWNLWHSTAMFWGHNHCAYLQNKESTVPIWGENWFSSWRILGKTFTKSHAGTSDSEPIVTLGCIENQLCNW